jgi:uncharacterized protein (DUF1697 family)
MPHYIAFLRGVNLGKRRIKMDRLAALFEELGLTKVETFIASGNVLFESKVRDDLKLANQIERHLAKSLGYEVETFIRTRNEIAAVAAFQPFAKADLANPANTVHVGFLKEPLSAETVHKLIDCRTAVDEFTVDGRDYYWLCRIKSHESKVWASPRMKAVTLPSATRRNLTTIRKLAALNPVLAVL